MSNSISALLPLYPNVFYTMPRLSPSEKLRSKNFSVKTAVKRFLPSAVCLSLMAFSVYLESFSSLDWQLAELFFTRQGGFWLVGKDATPLLHFVFYDLLKTLVAVGDIAALAAAVFSGWQLRRATGAARLKAVRRLKNSLLFFFAVSLIPFIVGQMKSYTGISCPDQLLLFDGSYHYITLYERFFGDISAAAPHGSAFPAGHAAGGFALTCVWFFSLRKKLRRRLLIAAIIYGAAMGIYQMARGEHFLSHTLFTVGFAWQMNILLAAFVGWLLHRRRCRKRDCKV